MIKLLKRHYNAIVKRGLINEKTHFYEFLLKISEEFEEVLSESNKYLILPFYNPPELSDDLKQELIDLISACNNLLIHFNVDIEQELLKNIETQEKRANEKNNPNKD